jgi:hypothetical protein
MMGIIIKVQIMLEVDFSGRKSSWVVTGGRILMHIDKKSKSTN